MKRRFGSLLGALVLLISAVTMAGCPNNVTSPRGVTSVTLNKNELTLEEGKSEKLTATVKPANAANKKVTWSSDKPDVAAVDKDGKVTAQKAGEAVITVKSEDGAKTASCTVRVTAKAPPIPTYVISFSVDGTGGTLKAKADGVTETDKSPISVEKDKTVTFTAKPADGYEVEKWTVNGTTVANNVSTTYSHKVTTAVMVKVSFKVLPPPAVAVTGVTLDKPTVSLVAGTSTTLTATVLPANATNKTVTWSSDKPDVAAVNKDGKVTAHKAGEAVITVKSEDGGKTASCTVTVSLTEYAITYHLDGGSNHADNPAKYTVETETIILKDAAKANYRFAGWYANAGFTGEKVTQIAKGSTGNKAFWAKWEAVTYSIIYHLNDGMNDSGNPAKYTVETETITLKDAERTGYAFMGWYEKADFTGEKVTQITKGSTGNKELYAKWGYLVRFSVEGENGTLTAEADSIATTSNSPVIVEPNTEVTFTATAKEGFAVDKWEVFPSGALQTGGTEGNSTASVKITGETTVKVTFKPIDVGSFEDAGEFVKIIPPAAGITGKEPTYPLPGTNATNVYLKGVFRTGRKVKLSPYKLGKTEVTYELWYTVRTWAETKGYTFANKGLEGWDDSGGGGGYPNYTNIGKSPTANKNHPVTMISWQDCIVWCNAYTQKMNGSEAECVYRKSNSDPSVLKDATDGVACGAAYADMSKKGFRLPTEAEWEYAARWQSESTNADSYGGILLTKLDSASGAKGKWYTAETGEVAWYLDNANKNTHPVGEKRANALGLYDMSGNVSEYCFDWYETDPTINDDAYKSGEFVSDPQGAASGTDRVVRGSSWYDGVKNSAVGQRGNMPIRRVRGNEKFGLRLACRP